MYDRKTWIVVIACSILLALNFYFTPKVPLETKDPLVPSAAEGVGGDPEVGLLTESLPVLEEEATTVVLKTSEALFTLTTRGGGVQTAEMVNQKSVLVPDTHVVLNEGASSPVGALADGPDRIETVNYVYQQDQSIPGETVVFLGRHPTGLIVKKTWSKVSLDEPGSSYLLDLKVEVENPATSQSRLPLEQFSLFLGRAQPLQERELTPSGFFWREGDDLHFTKASAFSGGMFSKAKTLITEMGDEVTLGGVSSQLFATVIRPDTAAMGGVWSKGYEVTVGEEEKPTDGVRAGFNLPNEALDPGMQASFDYRLFMGPKDNRMLRQMGSEWGDVMNYGWFSVFSRFMNFLLVHVHDIVDKVSGKWSWGWAIIIVTLVVRSAMWPLYSRSNRTMKRMAKLKPEMDRIKEKYPDEPAKVQAETMGLYKKFGINPVGGCLPMLVQIPIFFGFYRMLQSAVELRGNGFLWVDDLSLPDTVATLPIFGGFPLNILPIVMALSSFGQMSMMPTTGGDKTQQTIMKFMPLMFFFFCYNFASALALYWTTSNVFSIFQTWWTQRQPDVELGPERPASNKKSFVERMAEAAEKQKEMKKANGRVVEPPKKKRGPRTGG